MISVQAFKGMAPRVSPGLLDNEQGVRVTGKVLSGELRPWSAPHVVAQCDPGTQGICRTDFGDWLAFDEPVQIHSSPNANDAFGRLYYTRESGGLYVVSPLDDYAEFRVGCPRPPVPPAVAVTGTATDPSSLLHDRVYLITYVNGWGEEGPPSDSSDFHEWREGQTVTLSDFPVPPLGFKEIVAIRIYRMAVGDTLADWFFVGEIPGDQETFVDNVEDGALVSGTLNTAIYGLPQDNARGLVPMGGGVFATFEGNELAFSEPFLPYTYPDEYRLSISGHVVALGYAGGMLQVLTTSNLWNVYGAHPESFALNRQSDVAPCVSPRGVVSMEGGVIFPSGDGLRVVSGGNSSGLLSRKVLQSDEWVSMFDPLNLVGAYHSGVYYGFYPGGGFALDLHSEVLTLTGVRADAVFTDGLSVFLAYDGSILEMDADAAFLRARFLSKIFAYPRPLNISSARVDVAVNAVAGRVEAWVDEVKEDNLDLSASPGDVGSLEVGGGSVAGGGLLDLPLSLGSRPMVLFRLFADGLLVFENVVQVGLPFRLPAGYMAREWQFFIESPAPVKRVQLGTSVRSITR